MGHPEGDVEVAPSSSGLGKVWTEQGAKKEILRIVNKQPTGKNAAHKHVIHKMAQDVPWGHQRGDSPAKAGNVSDANVQIAGLWSELDDLKKQAISGLGASGPFWNFSEEEILKDSTHAAHYSELSGVTTDAINKYKDLLMAAYGSTTLGNVGNVFGRLGQKGVTAALAGATGLPYFHGSQPYGS